MNSRYDLATNDSIPSGLINKVRQFVFLCLSLFLAALVLIFAGQFLVLYLANPSSELHALFLDNLVWIQWFVGLTSVFSTLLFIRFVYQGNTLLRQFASSAIDGELTGFFEVSEPLAQNILNSAVDGIIIINQQGIIQHFNPAAQKLFGYESKEVLGHNVNKLMPSPNREMHDHYLARYLTSGNAKIIGTIRELEGQRKDGTVFPMELAVSEVALGQRRFFTGIIHDITRQKEIRSRLAVQNTVTNILSQANSLEEATPKILSEICSHLGWSVGELWLPDDRKAQLNLVTQWYASEEPGKEFAEVSQDTLFAKGIGLPGQWWRGL